MKWATPIAFAVLIPLAAIVVWSMIFAQRRRGTMQVSSLRLFAQMSQSFRVRFAWLPAALKVAAVVCVIVALARPQQSSTKVNKNVEGIDIMMAIDTSDSMEIEDMKPDNRITAAKQVIKKFIQGRSNDRIGLVVFSGEAYTRVPLTLDYPVLLESLAQVTTEGPLKQGTAIGVALANSVGRLRESTARSRVVILLTDGENNSGTVDPDTATDIAKGFGIRVYTIGAGVNGQAQLPVYSTDAFGRRTKHYQPIHSTVNEELLERIAVTTGGKYFRAADTDALRKVFSTIDSLERTKIQVKEYTKYTELFPPWVLWAVVLYALQFLLGQTLLRRAP